MLPVLAAMALASLFGTSFITQIENLGGSTIYGLILFALIGTAVQILYIKSNYFGSLAFASFFIGLITSVLVLVIFSWIDSLVEDKSFLITITDWEMILGMMPLFSFLFVFCSIIAGICFFALREK